MGCDGIYESLQLGYIPFIEASLRVCTLGPSRRTMSSLPWLMPKPSFWGPKEILVMTQARNYTVADYESLFRDMGWEAGWEMYKDEASFGADFAPPRVENHNYYGVNVSTASAFLYSYWFPFPGRQWLRRLASRARAPIFCEPI